MADKCLYETIHADQQLEIYDGSDDGGDIIMIIWDISG